MEITQHHDGNSIVVSVAGRLNTGTAPELDKGLSEVVEGTSSVVLDLQDLAYISSAGLRVILSTQKAMNRKQGSLVVRNCKPEILEVFEMTGFVDFLTIE